MPTIRCPQCREKMQVDPSDLGERVVCPGCDHRFAAREDSPGDERPSERSRSNSRLDDGFDRPRPQRKSNALLWIILALVGLFVVLPCLCCIGFFVYFDNAKADFPATWTDHSMTATDRTPSPITAAFPIPPVTKFLRDPENDGTGSTLSVNNIQQNGALTDAMFLIGYVDYPTDMANPLDKAYVSIRNAITAQHLYNPLIEPQVASESSTTVGGYPAKEAVYVKEHGHFILRIIHVNDRPRGSTVRLVVILAGGTGMKDADKQKFLDSVKIGKGK